MKKRSFAFVLGVVGALALVACKSESGGTTGGAGGSGNSGGNGGSGTCVDKCATAITSGGDVCSGTSSADLYDNLVSCASGACAAECPSFVQGTGTPDSDAGCGDCLTASCGTDLTDCSNDF